MYLQTLQDSLLAQLLADCVAVSAQSQVAGLGLEATNILHAVELEDSETSSALGSKRFLILVQKMESLASHGLAIAERPSQVIVILEDMMVYLDLLGPHLDQDLAPILNSELHEQKVKIPWEFLESLEGLLVQKFRIEAARPSSVPGLNPAEHALALCQRVLDCRSVPVSREALSRNFGTDQDHGPVSQISRTQLQRFRKQFKLFPSADQVELLDGLTRKLETINERTLLLKLRQILREVQGNDSLHLMTCSFADRPR